MAASAYSMMSKNGPQNHTVSNFEWTQKVHHMWLIQLSWVKLSWVESSWFKLSRVESSWVESSWFESSLLHFATFCLVISSLCSTNGFCMLDILDNFWPLMRVSMDHSQKAVLIAILHNFIFAKNLRKKWITQRDFNEGYFLKWDKKFMNFIGGKIPT